MCVLHDSLQDKDCGNKSDGRLARRLSGSLGGGRRLGLAVAEEGEEAWLLWVSQDPMAGQSMDWKEWGTRHLEPDLLRQESCTMRRPWH